MKMKQTAAVPVAAIIFAFVGSQALAADAGKVIYEKSCVGCHGADGKGNPAIAKTLGEKGLNLVSKEATKKSDADLLKIIAEGAGKMPPSKKLSPEEHKQVLGYVRSLAK